MPPGIYRLPLELVRGVAAESSSRDLAALALTNRHFHAWVNPCLYEHNIKHEDADAAVWAAARGRLDTLLLLHETETRFSKTLVEKTWKGCARCRLLLPLEQFPRLPMKFTLLHLAARAGHDDVVSWLLQRGANVDALSADMCWCNPFRPPLSWTPLHVAICNSQETTVKFLLANNATLRKSGMRQIEALHTAAARGLSSTIRHLSTLSGFNPNVKDCTGRAPIHHVTENSASLDAIKALLDVGADVQGACDDGSPYRYTPLWIALEKGDLEVAVLLLQAGAKPFSQNDKDKKKVAPFRLQLLRRQRRRQVSLLEVALRKENSDDNSGRHGALQRKVIRALLDFGCDVNDSHTWLCTHPPTTALGLNPLILAMTNSSSATVRLLLERGAEVDRHDRRFSNSALRYALSERGSTSLTERVDKIKALVEHGADLLDNGIIMELIILRNAKAVLDAVADCLGPDNLTDSHKIPMALGICCVFQERRIYESIKRYAGVQARATDEDIRYTLEQASRSRRACVPASLDALHPVLDEMRPGLTVDGVLDQWRDVMSGCLVEWLEGMQGLESSEGGASGLDD